jgi:hypothetical protein
MVLVIHIGVSAVSGARGEIKVVMRNIAPQRRHKARMEKVVSSVFFMKYSFYTYRC